MEESRRETIDRLLREGLNYYGTGDVAEAVRCWRLVLGLDPAHAEARDYLETAGESLDAREPPRPGAAPAEALPGTLPEAAATPEPAAHRDGETSGTTDWGMRDLAAADAEADRPPAGAGEPPSVFDDPLAECAPAAAPAAGATGGDPGAEPVDQLQEEALRMFHAGETEAALDLFETVARRDPVRIEVQGYIELLRSRLLKSYRERIGDDAQAVRLRIETNAVMKFNLPASAGFVLSLVDGKTSVNELVSLSGLDAFETLRIVCDLVDAGIVEVAP